MNIIEKFGTWQPMITAPRDGTPFIAVTNKKEWAKGLYILHFKGRTFRYHSTPSRIFENMIYLRCWMPLPPSPNEMPLP